MYGKETNEGATHWWVYSAMSSTVHPPLFKRFEFDADIKSRKARVVIPGVLESTARPIKSPSTGSEHHVRISLPNGIEFELAEIASGTTKTTASIPLDLRDSYFHFNAMRQSGKGLVRRCPIRRHAWRASQTQTTAESAAATRAAATSTPSPCGRP